MDTYSTNPAPQQAAVPQGQQPGQYDFEAYDRVWQRVFPELTPYPVQEQPPLNLPDLPANEQVGQLPGAERNPCCMGTEAQQSIHVIEGFTENEIALCRFYKEFARCVSNRKSACAIQKLQEMQLEHVRRLKAIYYLITGQCMVLRRQLTMPAITNYCDTLRAAYHEETCSSFNYYRAAVGAPDPCLRALFERLGGAKARQAEMVIEMLAAAVRC